MLTVLGGLFYPCRRRHIPVSRLIVPLVLWVCTKVPKYRDVNKHPPVSWTISVWPWNYHKVWHAEAWGKQVLQLATSSHHVCLPTHNISDSWERMKSKRNIHRRLSTEMYSIVRRISRAGNADRILVPPAWKHSINMARQAEACAKGWGAQMLLRSNCLCRTH
jgi:hypothetical protein